jgi:hypothetical protein
VLTTAVQRQIRVTPARIGTYGRLRLTASAQGDSPPRPVPPCQDCAADEGQRTDDDPRSAACHEALRHNLRVHSLECPDSAHQSEDDTHNESSKSHTRIVDPRICQSVHSGTYLWSLDTWKLRNRGSLPVSTKEPRVAEVLAHDRKTTGKSGGYRQYDSYQRDEYEWVHRDRGSGSGSQVVDLTGHAMHGDAWQRRHLSGMTPVRPPAPETTSGSLITAHMGGG